MTKKIISLLDQKKLSLVFAESMTGGLLSYEMTKRPGASKVFKGSVVAYQKTMKKDVLHIDDKTLNNYLIVSEEIAMHMAKNALRISHASIAVGVTGDAGPSLQKGSQIRQAIYAICDQNHCKTYHVYFDKESRYKAQIKTKNEIFHHLYDFIRQL